MIATLMRPQGDTGVQTHFTTFMRWLAKRGHASILVTPFSAPSWQTHPTFAMRRLIHPFNGAWSVWWYRHWHAFFVRRSLQRALSSGNPCVVYAQCPLSAKAALDARRSPLQRVVLVVHFNESQADEWVGKGMLSATHSVYAGILKTEVEVLGAVDGLVHVSEFMRRNLVERFPCAVRRAEVIPNFVDDPLVNAGSGSEILDAPSSRDLISIGTLEPRKNQSYLLDIVAAGNRKGRSLTLTIVGDGQDMAALRSKAMHLGIEPLVRFEGRVANAAALMSVHRACIHVALQESFGIVLIEALARGRPVFASHVGGMPEVFCDGAQGRFIPLNDAAAAAVIVSEWMRQPERLDLAGKMARSHFLRNFETDAVAHRLMTFLQDTADQS